MTPQQISVFLTLFLAFGGVCAVGAVTWGIADSGFEGNTAVAVYVVVAPLAIAGAAAMYMSDSWKRGAAWISCAVCVAGVILPFLGGTLLVLATSALAAYASRSIRQQLAEAQSS